MLQHYQNTMDKMILNLGIILLAIAVGKSIALASRVTTDPELYVQRETRGELKCQFKHKGDVSSVTWLKGENYDDAVEVVKYFMGWKTGPKYNKGYDMGPDNSTLIIENVKEEDAGTWWCAVVVADPWTDRSSTNVTVTVPPVPPTISQCPTGQPCEIKVDKDDTNYTVTCTAIGSKPAVTLILYKDDKKVDVDPQHRANSEDPSTYDTILEIPLSLQSDKDEFVITCEAIGHHSLPDSEKTAQQVLKIQRSKQDPTMSKRKDENPKIGNVKIGIYAGVGAVVAIALIISIIIAAFIVSSRMQPKRRDRYRGAKKKKKRNTQTTPSQSNEQTGTLGRPRYPTPPPSPDAEETDKHDYENLPKGFRNGLCAKSPVYQSPVSAC